MAATTRVPTKAVTVRATERGWYGGRIREAGDVFDIDMPLRGTLGEVPVLDRAGRPVKKDGKVEMRTRPPSKWLEVVDTTKPLAELPPVEQKKPFAKHVKEAAASGMGGTGAPPAVGR